MGATKKSDDDAVAFEQLKALLERAHPLAVEWRTAYEGRLNGEQAARSAELEKLRLRLPFDSEIVRRRDWMGVSLSTLMIVGGLGLAGSLVFTGHVPEALQVFSLMVGWFVGRASRNGGDTPGRSTQ